MRCALILLAHLFVFDHTMAQEDRAFEAFSKNDWNQAIALFKQSLRKDPYNFTSYAYLGTSLNNVKQYEEALAFLQKSLAYANHLSAINYARWQLARSYAGLNRREDALVLLKQIAENAANFPLTDSVFFPYAKDAEFIAVARKMKENFRPCLYDSRYQKFNFFIGVWDVYTGQNYANKVAVDSVTLAPSGCSVHENFIWTAGSDFRGVSMIYFDPGTQRYKMCWTGSNADIRTFEEARIIKDTVELVAVTTTKNNELIQRRMLIAIDPSEKKIHQYIENSFDQGRT